MARVGSAKGIFCLLKGKLCMSSVTNEESESVILTWMVTYYVDLAICGELSYAL